MLTALLALLLSFVVHDRNIQLTLHPNDSTVLVTVEVGNDDYYRSSAFYTGGANCRKGVCAVDFRDLPSGELHLWVTETNRADEITNTDKRTFYIR